MILIIEDEAGMTRCIERACRPHEVQITDNAIAAMQMIDNSLPKLIFLDILLIGPNGFTLLHELASYEDTAEIPVVIVSSVEVEGLEDYGVVAILNKESLLPGEIKALADKYDA